MGASTWGGQKAATDLVELDMDGCGHWESNLSLPEKQQMLTQEHLSSLLLLFLGGFLLSSPAWNC